MDKHPWVNAIRLSSVNLTDAQAETLTGRLPRPIPLECCRPDLAGQTVLVTGAGGFIGSEICRALLTLGVARIVAFDRDEQSLAGLAEELPAQHLVLELGDICDSARFHRALRNFKPVHIYHAAAYKNVPFLERFLYEAVENNVLATWDIAQAAIQTDVQSFVLVSSDKAASATNVLGRTKRLAEILLTGIPPSSTRFAAVRCANVLGSPGSVLPRFLEQLFRGEPLTVTSSTASRYFMTAAEAAHAILVAAHLTEGGEIFIPGAGDPVGIAALAANLIATLPTEQRPSLVQNFSGLRPGDRESESLIAASEIAHPTACPSLQAVRALRDPVDLSSTVAALRSACLDRDRDRLLKLL